MLLAAVICQPVDAQEVDGCGNLRNHLGPFDYRSPTARQEFLGVVEAYHFTSEVETLKAGRSGYLIGDIDYTLRVFPNHHRALNAVSRYELNGNQQWTNPETQSAECYFRRAIAFQPEDPAVRVLFGNYLFKRGRHDEARTEYEEALTLAPQSADINYNAGLFFLSLGDLTRAKELANVAYADNYPLMGLKTKIAAAEAAHSKSTKK